MSPPPPKSRHDDEDAEAWQQRWLYGVAPPDSPELGMGFGQWGLKARGLGVTFLLSVLAVVLSTVYSGYRLEQTVTRETQGVTSAILAVLSTGGIEHRALRIDQQRTSCILTMSQEDRTKFRRFYQSGAFKQECPWVDE